MKNVDKLYKKYYNAYKNDYDNNGKLSEGKKKKIDCKQFELFDKTNKKLKKKMKSQNWLHYQNGCTKNDFKEAIKLIEDIRTDTNNVKSNGNKKVSNDLNELINNIKNSKTTRKSTIKKIRNIASDLDQLGEKESTLFQNKMIDVVYYLFNSLGISSKPNRLMLPKWVKVSEERFNEILSTVTKAKNEGLRTNVDGREITLDNTEILLKDLGIGTLDGNEFKREYNNIVSDVNAIINKLTITRNQEKMVKIMSLLKEIPKLDEKPDTKDMPELESEESASERRNQQGQGLKILTPNQMITSYFSSIKSRK